MVSYITKDRCINSHSYDYEGKYGYDSKYLSIMNGRICYHMLDVNDGEIILKDNPEGLWYCGVAIYDDIQINNEPLLRLFKDIKQSYYNSAYDQELFNSYLDQLDYMTSGMCEIETMVIEYIEGHLNKKHTKRSI